LALLLEYEQWRNSENVSDKVILAAKTVGADDIYHFADFSKMAAVGSGNQREIKDFALSRYACYLIIQNADPAKTLVSIGQTYFAIQTRRQELSDRSPELIASTAKDAGIQMLYLTSLSFFPYMAYNIPSLLFVSPSIKTAILLTL
jgi:hypothetical protein